MARIPGEPDSGENTPDEQEEEREAQQERRGERGGGGRAAPAPDSPPDTAENGEDRFFATRETPDTDTPNAGPDTGGPAREPGDDEDVAGGGVSGNGSSGGGTGGSDDPFQGVKDETREDVATGDSSTPPEEEPTGPGTPDQPEDTGAGTPDQPEDMGPGRPASKHEWGPGLPAAPEGFDSDGLEHSTRSTVARQATDLEEEFLEKNPDFRPEDVKIVRTDDGMIRTEVSEQAERRVATDSIAEQFDDEYENVDLNLGDIDVFKNDDDEFSGTLNERGKKKLLLADFDENYQSAGLDIGDVEVTETEDDEFSGELTDSGMSKVEAAAEERVDTGMEGLGFEGTDSTGYHAPEAAGVETFQEQQRDTAKTGIGIEGVDTGQEIAPASGEGTFREQQIEEGLRGVGFEGTKDEGLRAPDAAGEETFREQQRDTAKVGIGVEGVDTGRETAPSVAGVETFQEQQRDTAKTGIGIEGVDTGLETAPTSGEETFREKERAERIDTAMSGLGVDRPGDSGVERDFEDLDPYEKLSADVADDEPTPGEAFDDAITTAGEFAPDTVVDAVSDVADHYGSLGPVQVRATPDDEFQPVEDVAWEAMGGETGAFGETGISPSVAMSLQGVEAVEARAEKEQDILDWRDADDEVGVITPSSVAGGMFGLGQQVERTGIETGEAISEAIPAADIGPRVGDETIGDIPANVAGGTTSFLGMGAGAALQFPASFAYDVEQITEGEDAPGGIEGTFDAPANFLGTQVEMVSDYPLSTAAGFALPGTRVGRGFERGLGDAGVTTPRRPTVQRINLGETRGVTVGVTRLRGRVTETQPGLSLVREPARGTRVETGTPDVPLEGIFGEQQTLSPDMTAAEAGILAESLRAADRPAEATKIEAFRDVQAETQQSGLRPDQAEDVVGDVLESQGIPRDAAGPVTDLLAAEEGQLYGSTVQRASAQQIGEPGVARTPRDIDVGGLESSLDFARQAELRINEPFDSPVVMREGASVRSRRTGEELFDLHEVGEISPEGSPSLFGRDLDRFGVREDPTVRTSEGVETTTLPEQTRRKGMGATETIASEPGDVGPIQDALIRPTHEGRVKDIPDFYVGERANIEALRLQGREASAGRAETGLESFVDAFGEDLAQRARSEYDLAQAGEIEGPRTQLIDFSDTGTSADMFGGDGLGAGASPGVFAESGSPSSPPSPGVSGGMGGSSPFGFGDTGSLGVFDSPAPDRFDGGESPSPGLFDPVEPPSPVVTPGVESPDPVSPSQGPAGEPVSPGLSGPIGEVSPPPSPGGPGGDSGPIAPPSVPPVDIESPPSVPPSPPPSMPPYSPPDDPPPDGPPSLPPRRFRGDETDRRSDKKMGALSEVSEVFTNPSIAPSEAVGYDPFEDGSSPGFDADLNGLDDVDDDLDMGL